MREIVAILLLVVGILLTADLQHDFPPRAVGSGPSPLAAPQLTISYAPARLSISGTSASSRHEAALVQQAQSQFRDAELVVEFMPGVIVSTEWVSVSQRLLDTAASMASVEARMTTTGIDLRGVTADPQTTTSRIEALREDMPASATLSTDIIVIRPAASLDDLCRQAFAALVPGPISFERSSAELRPSSLAALDRITEFAHDCPTSTIVITGHTDSSGVEAWNLQLSLSRARAVADQIVRNGIDPGRLQVVGVGSSEPIADNATAYGRELNRRIEFDLR